MQFGHPSDPREMKFELVGEHSVLLVFLEHLDEPHTCRKILSGSIHTLSGGLHSKQNKLRIACRGEDFPAVISRNSSSCSDTHYLCGDP